MISTGKLQLSVLATVLMLLGNTTYAAVGSNGSPDPEARAMLKQLIEINTTHAIGTAKAVTAIAARLKLAGFAAQDIHTGGTDAMHQNIVVRLRGTGARKPLLFITHLDVVEAKRSDWSLDPFVLTEQDGYFYGRGTEDIKGEGVNLLVNIMRLKREGYRPDRDLIVALTDGEEAGGDNFNGINWLLTKHRNWIDAEYVLNLDGGGGEIKNGTKRALDVQTSEKLYRTFELSAASKGGHSSQPPKENAIYELTTALNRLASYSFPVQLNETTRAYFSQMANLSDGAEKQAMQGIVADINNASANQYLSANPYYNALLRTTCVTTMINGGHAENALPQHATATIQCRLVPDDTVESVQQQLLKVIADDKLELKNISQSRPSPASPLLPELMQAIQTVSAKHWPNMLVLPVMSTGASDGSYLRAAGVPVYGTSGLFGDVDDERAHGKDERILVTSFYESISYVHDLMKYLSSH